MKTVYQTIAIIMLALLMCFAGSSCSDDYSGNRMKSTLYSVPKDATSDSLTFRARAIYYYDNSNLGAVISQYTDLVKVPKGYFAGDTVMIELQTYILGLHISDK